MFCVKLHVSYLTFRILSQVFRFQGNIAVHDRTLFYLLQLYLGHIAVHDRMPQHVLDFALYTTKHVLLLRWRTACRFTAKKQPAA